MKQTYTEHTRLGIRERFETVERGDEASADTASGVVGVDLVFGALAEGRDYICYIGWRGLGSWSRLGKCKIRALCI